MSYILAIDEGTTNSKAILVDVAGRIVAQGSAMVPTSYPQPGWVEQDAAQIWASTLAAVRDCVGQHSDIAAIGISNQRESVLIWDRATGQALGPVITWQCRRTAAVCDTLRAEQEAEVIRRTGLPLDPLFPATKIAWLMEHIGRRDGVCIGTVDSWLIWNLTGGRVHATDASNAARTQLFNIADMAWDPVLCDLFGVDVALLPVVHDSAHVYGTTLGVPGLRDGIPIAAAIGDSHAALFGHGARRAGDGKVTFGTGSSVMTTLDRFVAPPKGITTTVAWVLDGRATYAFEGNITVSAAILPWTAAMLGLDVDGLLALAESVPDSGGVSLVPAHAGLGAPHWDAGARGLMCGLSFSTTQAHIARAAVDSMALQVQDVLAIILAHGDLGRLFVDGGPSRNPFLMGLVADYLDHALVVSQAPEASALGAAMLAGLAVGFWPDLAALDALRGAHSTLAPRMEARQRQAVLRQWDQAIARTLGVPHVARP